MSADLVAFLLARINEDEAIAKEHSGDAAIHYTGCYYYSYSLDANWFCDCEDLGDDPAIRLLAECYAKRRILSRATTFGTGVWGSSPRPTEKQLAIMREEHAYALRSLAAVYSTHPDYLKEWKP